MSDQDGIGTIQELGMEEGILLPVLKHILCRGGCGEDLSEALEIKYHPSSTKGRDLYFPSMLTPYRPLYFDLVC